MAALVSIQVGKPKTYGDPQADDPMDKEWRTAIYKTPVQGPLALSKMNLAGDIQADKRFHGGVDKAVNVYPSEHYAHWMAELKLPEVAHGAFGENFTTRGLVETEVCVGDVFQIGETRVQVSQPRQPCGKLARRWRIKDFVVQVVNSSLTGWYLRVLREGEVESGMEIWLIERAHPEWTLAAANEVMHFRKKDLIAAQALAECAALSSSWRKTLLDRIKSKS